MPNPNKQGEHELTPFAQLLADYMRQDWPPVTIPKLAERTHVSVQSVYDWFNKGTLPRASTIELIAEGTGIPRRDLYQAAGIPMPDNSALDRIKRQIEAERGLTPDAKRLLLAAVDKARSNERDVACSCAY